LKKKRKERGFCFSMGRQIALSDELEEDGWEGRKP
jgi:hypothetical protein